MPNIEFLLVNNLPPRSVEESVNRLRDASTLFVSAWNRKDELQAARASQPVIMLFDHIVGELMRERDDIQSGSKNANPEFMTALDNIAAQLVSPVTIADQQAVIAAGHGNAHLPTRATVRNATLQQTLNKIKHQIKQFANFRIENGRHWMVICANKLNGQPDCVLEFDVEAFCELCLQAHSHIQS